MSPDEAHPRPSLLELLCPSTMDFARTWYGWHSGTMHLRAEPFLEKSVVGRHYKISPRSWQVDACKGEALPATPGAQPRFPTSGLVRETIPFDGSGLFRSESASNATSYFIGCSKTADELNFSVHRLAKKAGEYARRRMTNLITSLGGKSVDLSFACLKWMPQTSHTTFSGSHVQTGGKFFQI